MLLLRLLTACATPTVEVALPRAPPATHGSTLEAARLLTPTPFGAESDVICPWARGEAVPDASIARWVAEKRLAWRVLELAPEARFGGLPIADVASLAAAADSVEARCGALPPRDFLLAAGPDVPYGRIADGLYQLGKERFNVPWLLVDDPDPATTSPASLRPRSDGVPAGLSGLEGGRTQDAITLVVGDPPQVFAFDGRVFGSVDQALAQHPGCVVVAAAGDSNWGQAVALADAAIGSGGEVMLALVADDRPSPATGELPAPSGGRLASLHTRLAVLPVIEPTVCGSESGCGCGGALVGAGAENTP